MLCFTANAATYYVTQGGGAAPADGSDYAHSMSVATHNDGDDFSGNDLIYLCDQITSTVTIPSSGTSGNEINYSGACPSHTVDIYVGTTSYGINTNAKDYLTFDNIVITRADTGIINNARPADSDYVTITNSTLSGITTHGIGVVDSTNWTIGGSAGNGNDLSDCGGGTSGSDINLNTNSVDTIISYNLLYGNGVDEGVDGITTEHTNGVLIEHNKIYDHYREDGIDLKKRSHNIIIRYNEIYGNAYSGITAQMGSYDVYIYGNRIHDNSWAGVMMKQGDLDDQGGQCTTMSNINIWSNLIYHNASGVLSARSGDCNLNINDIRIYNNAIAENGNKIAPQGSGAMLLQDGTGLEVKNNIFYKNQDDTGDSIPNQQVEINAYVTVVFDNNIYWDTTCSGGDCTDDDMFTITATDYNFAEWQALDDPTDDIYDNSSTQEDPDLVAKDTHNYRLDSSASPCFGAGVDAGQCWYPVIAGTTYTVCLDYGLDEDSDFTDLTTVTTKDQGVSPEIGAYVYGSGAAETDNPTPDPATWSVEPVGASTVAATMTATTGSDVSTPTLYQFNHIGSGDADCITDGCADAGYGTGGTTGTWQESPTYVDAGLQLNKCYCYEVEMKDNLDNTGTASAIKHGHTWAATPGASTLGNATDTTLDITEVDENSNTAGTWMAVKCTSTSPTDSTWLNKWVNDADGTPEAAEQWIGFETWDAEVTVGSGTVELLNECTTYCFRAKAINAGSVQTDLGAEVCLETTGDCGLVPITTGFGVTMNGVRFN